LEIDGPAVIDATVVLRAGDRGRVDRFGSIEVDL
jgi:hypothetical protein